MLEHTHLETPTPTPTYIQKRPKKSLFLFFQKESISQSLFRRSMPNCGASVRESVRDQKSSPVSIVGNKRNIPNCTLETP